VKIPIRHIPDVAVILDADLAAIYRVPTKRLNEQVKRNKERFPAVKLNSEEARGGDASRSQIATLNKGQNIKHLPYAFTGHGALMAANVLRSPEAVKMSVFIVRAFVRQREMLAGNEAVLRRLEEIDKTLVLHDRGLRDLYQKLLPLLQAPSDPPKRELGFHVREQTATYRVKRRCS
jgi:hypothetical protein